MKKRIILGIGILIILLALAGTGSARFAYASDCSYCHSDYPRPLTAAGAYFNDTHKFNGLERPASGVSCTQCHVDPGNAVAGDFTLTAKGTSYSLSHRYDSTTLASKMLSSPGCGSCHVDAIGGNFNLLTGTPTYLKSTTCQACHKAKYDKWSNTLHAVMLTPASKAQAMNLPTPSVGWAGISYVIVSKFEFAYIDTAGYFLASNDAYETEAQTFADSSHAGGKYGTCGRCHTTGWNASATNTELPGFTGTLVEPGIACERCHGPGGNGHQVVVNYSGNQCRECHTGGNHGTGWENGEHAPPPYEIGSNCMFCHSSFDQYKNQNVTEEAATGVSCGVCHNIHDMTDAKYAATFTGGTFDATAWSEVADSKLAFFNATASRAAGTDVFDNLSSINLLYPGVDSSRKDSSYGTAPINVTGRPDSEKLCSMCHYRHGIAHMSGVRLSHANGEATCVDCHMGGANATVGKDMMKKHDNDPLTVNSCGTARCHSSMTTLIKEWKGSAHNVKEVGVAKDGYNHYFGRLNATTGVASSRANSCNKCHSPRDWNPATAENVTTTIPLTADFNGITCGVCHNLHDMGTWLTNTAAAFGTAKPYAWYNRDGVFTTRYKANYTMQENTIELCGNCHSNIRYGNTGPGWVSGAANPVGIHGFPAKDMFVGSWKESSVMKFECVDCHFATLKRDASGNRLPASQRILGHSFKVNATLLQSNTACSSCHVTGGSPVGDVSTTIETIQEEIHPKWNTTNTIVTDALNTVKAFAGEKNTSRTNIAQAYWNLRFVSSDESWGVHNPTKANQLLDDAVTYANLAITSLPAVTRGNTTIGVYQNSTGTFSLRNSNSGGAADITVVYSPVSSTGIPLVGDWNGTGNDTIGIYNSSAGSFNLNNRNSAGYTSFRYGDAGDIPLVGDWNGDGIDTIGIYRNGAFYLKNVNTAGYADLTFGYGDAGDIPVVGDWNNDGKDTVGVYRNGVFYLRNTNDGGYADVTLGYGDAGDKPLVGDWNNDGTDTVGVYRSGSFYLRNSNTPGYADIQFVSELTGDTPIAGDWDGQ